RQPERRLEYAGEVRLIGEAGVARDLGQRALLMNPVPRELEATHKQVAVRARPEHDPELAAQVVPGQPRDGLELRRMHDAGLLRVQEPSSPLDGGRVYASRYPRPGPVPLSSHQSPGKAHNDAVDGQRLQGETKGLVDGLRQDRVGHYGLAQER